MPRITGRGSRVGKSDGRFVAAKSRGGLFEPDWPWQKPTPLGRFLKMKKSRWGISVKREN